MGVMDFLFGGMGSGPLPDPTYAHQGQIQGLINQGLGIAGNRGAPQVDPSMQAQFRGGQMGQVNQLQQIAGGQQQGAGELAAQRQAANAAAQQQAMARMSRGGNAGLAMRDAANNTAGIGLNAAGMGQQAAMQDQMNAQGLLTQALGQGRNQDLSLAGQNAALQQSQQAQNDQMYQQMLQQLTGMDMNQMNAQYQTNAANAARPGFIGSLMSNAGPIISGAAMLSDERVKEDVMDGGDEVDAMLRELQPFSYKYKNEERHGQGERVGILAQDLRKSRLGYAATIDHEDGIALDVNKALSAALASVARLDKRLRAVGG